MFGEDSAKFRTTDRQLLDATLSFDDLHCAVRYELFEEFSQRQREAETLEGQLVRELLVEEDDRDEMLLSLGR